MNIRFGAKDAPFIRTSGTKNPFENSTIFPLFWGRIREGVQKNAEKNALMFEYIGRCGRYLDPCIAPT
jgi:hypothetical protein